MAITLNRHAAVCEQIMEDEGKMNDKSSPRVALYEISREWRLLCDADPVKTPLEKWSERERTASDLLIATLCYLRRIGCKDIESLLQDRMGQRLSEC